MPESFARIPHNLLENFERSCVLTPNERLARELSSAFDHAMIETKRRAWTTLKCQSLSRFWLELYAILEEAGLTSTRLLPAHIINMRFQQTAPKGLENQCRIAVEAWMLTRRYGINLDSPQMHTSRSAYFSGWCNRAQPEISSAETVESDLPGLLCKHIDDLLPLIEAPPMLIDIEHLAPDEIRFFEELDERLTSGVAMYSNQTWHSRFDANLGLTPKPKINWAGAKDAVYHSYETQEQELMAASQWCRHILEATPSARIGVVVPDLDAQYDRVLRQFSAALSPESGSSAPIFDISGGNSLVHQPVWRHARILLDWIQQPADQTSLAPMLNSPFLYLPWCSDLKSSWPKQARRHLQVTAFARVADAQALLSLVAALPSRARLDRWIKHLLDLLSSAKWPMTKALGSFQYQATKQIQETLATLALQTDDTLLTYAEALNIIDWSLDQTFAPKRLASNIQILGLLESTGLTFTHLWVCGMSAEQFPGRAKLSSFIPRRTALAHGMPRSSQTQELAFAERMLDGWLRRSEQICFSFAQSDQGMPMDPTTLLADICDVTPGSEAFTPFQLSNRHPHMQPSRTALMVSQDIHGSPAPVGLIAGGSGRLETHAACPFMGFAVYRLGLQQPLDARDLLDARERGSLLHWILEKVYSLAPNSDQVKALAEDSLESICAEALKRHGKLPKPFAESEKIRLIKLIRGWLAIEADRDTFDVIETEHRHTVNLGDWQLQLRIDRLDKVGNDLVVIDYKSGNTSTAAALSKPMTAPQLPLYSLIRDDITGVYYAQLKHDDQKIIGVGDKNPQLGATKHRQMKTTEPDNRWAAQRMEWRSELMNLAAQIGAGDARVDPKPNACRYCHLKSLCRVDEKRQMAAAL